MLCCVHRLVAPIVCDVESDIIKKAARLNRAINLPGCETESMSLKALKRSGGAAELGRSVPCSLGCCPWLIAAPDTLSLLRHDRTLDRRYVTSAMKSDSGTDAGERNESTDSIMRTNGKILCLSLRNSTLHLSKTHFVTIYTQILQP